MSAFVLPHPHIDALVQSMMVEKIITGHMVDDIGCQLIYENMVSCYTQYPHLENKPQLNSIDYHFRGIEAPLNGYCVLVACRGWKYQTCEYDEADSQPGWLLVSELEEVLINEHNLDPDRDVMDQIHPSARSTGWVIEDLNQIVWRTTS